MGEKFEAFEPIGTRTDSSHSSASSDSTTPLSPDHPLTHVSPTPTPTRVSLHRKTARMVVHTQPTLSLSMSSHIAEATALSPSYFRKRYRSSYETSSSSSPTLPGRKRYRGTSELILDIDKEEEVVPEGQQQGVPVVKTDVSEPLGLGYRALRRRELAVEEGQVPSTLEVVSPSSPVVSSPIASPVATPTTTISVDEDQFIEVGAQLELHGSQEWLETRCSCRGHVDTRLADMSHDRYDDHRLIHDMLVQQAAMQRELREMRGRVGEGP
ncbi:hypothetical protein Tco_1127631 [Tanacetum coccineum]